MYNYNFVNITRCTVQAETLLPYGMIYITILIALMLYFALHNVQLKSRYHEEGRVSSIVIILSCIFFGISYIISLSLRRDPQLYFIQPVYMVSCTTLVPLITMAVMFLPGVNLCTVCMRVRVYRVYAHVYITGTLVPVYRDWPGHSALTLYI